MAEHLMEIRETRSRLELGNEVLVSLKASIEDC
jgi:hypothetical protein